MGSSAVGHVSLAVATNSTENLIHRRRCHYSKCGTFSLEIRIASPIYVCVIFIAIACASVEQSATDNPTTATSQVLQSPILRTISEERPPCLGMVKTFCENLYSPSNQGTLAVPLAGAAIEIKKGQTENDFSQVYFEYAETQIKFRDRLPRDFRTILSHLKYFQKLKVYLSRKPRTVMTLEERADVVRLAHEIEALWNAAISESSLKRMERKYPGYSRIKEDLIPLELKHESSRVRNILLSEIAKAVWAEHPKWNEVERQFQDVRDAFIHVISNQPSLSKEIKEDWLERIRASSLIVPGSDPEVDMLACSRTEENAYYYTNKNYLTVCAGDFNSEDVRHTLSHELAHSLDFSRSLTIFESRSPLGVRLSQLRNASCSAENFSCERWADFRSTFEESTKALANFKVQLPEFQSCLKVKKTTSPIPEDYLVRVAKEKAQKAISDLAEKNAFLRMISSELPAPNGKPQKNPMYLNPCRYYLWDSALDLFDEELSGLLFFTSEYRCTQNLPSPDRFQLAVERTMEMETTLFLARMKAEGEYSSRNRLNADGYASSPMERFADSMAGLVFAHLLEKESDIVKRRAMYLGNIAWLCQKPSLQQVLPLEAGIQRKFYIESHSEDSQRQKELLPEEIRKALRCEKDFEMQECRL